MEHTYSLHGHTRSMSCTWFQSLYSAGPFPMICRNQPGFRVVHIMKKSTLTKKALASTIVPLVIQPSAMTSVSTSPMETVHSPGIPIELKIPLPASSEGSEDEDDHRQAEGIRVERPLNTAEESHKSAGPPESSAEQQDLIDEDAHTVVAKTASISLDELTWLVKLEQYANRSARSACARLNELWLSSALARRLIHSSSLAFRDMVDQFRNNDHSGFTASYQACEELVDACVQDENSRSSHDLYGGEMEPNLEISEDYSIPWIRKLPLAHQQDILEFLSRIRTDKSFLSSCISRLSSSELQTLASSHQPSRSSDSVFQHHFQNQTRSIGKERRTGMVAPRVGALRELHKNDPFFSLVYGVFDDTSDYGSQEHRLRVDVWSTACARILMENKHGSEDFVITMLDAFSSFQNWKLKPNMEMYLMKLLNRGAFLLDPPQPTNFKQPVEISNAQAAVAVSKFFDDALKDLFVLLVDDQSQLSVPAVALDFAHAVLSKIQDPGIRLRTKTFITSGWFFSSFISNVIVYPEVKPTVKS